MKKLLIPIAIVALSGCGFPLQTPDVDTDAYLHCMKKTKESEDFGALSDNHRSLLCTCEQDTQTQLCNNNDGVMMSRLREVLSEE